MFRLRYTIELIGTQWWVLRGNRRDLDLTRAIRHAGSGKAISTQRKVALFIERFLNFHYHAGEPHDAFLLEVCELGRERIDAFLEALGCTVSDADREDEASKVSISKASFVSALPSCLKGLRRFYARLAKDRLRPRANPCAIHNWHIMAPDVRRDLAMSVHGDRESAKNYTGAHYIIVDVPSYALRMEDPIGLGPRVLAAGKAFGWPAAIYDQVTVMREDGARWVDTFDLNAEDWGRASGLGRTLWAPNKASKGVRVKKIVVSVPTVAQLRKSFDEDPARPDMAELERLLAAGDWEALRRIPLFPSRLGTPFAYHTFNNDHFRPAMEEHQVTIRSESGGEARATAHRLRAGRIQEDADEIYRPGRTQKEIKVDEEALQEDVAIKSKKAFNRYIGPLREQRAETMKAARTDRRLGRAALAEDGVAAVSAELQSLAPPSAVERRLAALRTGA